MNPGAVGPVPELSGLRVVLVHDWLTGMRGGEKVLEIFCRLFPAVKPTKRNAPACCGRPCLPCCAHRPGL